MQTQELLMHEDFKDHKWAEQIEKVDKQLITNRGCLENQTLEDSEFWAYQQYYPESIPAASESIDGRLVLPPWSTKNGRAVLRESIEFGWFILIHVLYVMLPEFLPQTELKMYKEERNCWWYPLVLLNLLSLCRCDKEAP